MIVKVDKNAVRKDRHKRIRFDISGTASTPRLNVYRSAAHIYAQIVDDVKGATLASASTLSKDLKSKLSDKTKKEQAHLVGVTVAEKAKALGIETVVFDRGGYLYTGRVKEVADGARAAGLKF
jgi:large subunit ribosomal protein L18